MTLLDASIVFDYLVGRGTADRTAAILESGDAALSVITVYELYAGVTVKRHLRERDDLASICTVLPLTDPIAREAAGLYTRLKAAGNLVPNEDLLIAATALTHDCDLFTLNSDHFRRIPDLRLLS